MKTKGSGNVMIEYIIHSDF